MRVIAKRAESESAAERARRLAVVYRLLTSRARGSGWVIYRGSVPVGRDDLLAVADVEVDGQRGLIAVRKDCDGKE